MATSCSGITREPMDSAATSRERMLARSLAGRRVVVTRGGSAGELLVKRLESLGAQVVYCPTIAFAPPEDPVAFMHALATIGEHDWIAFTSANAVQSVAQALRTMFRTQTVPMPAIAAVGPATAAAVEALGWRVAFMPTRSSGEGLAAELPTNAGTRVLLPRADIASVDAPSTLAARGFTVTELVAYRTVTNAPLLNADSLKAGVDALTFSSPSTVAGFIQAATNAGWDPVAAQRVGRTVVVCIGETTANAVREYDLLPDATAVNATMESFIDALAICLSAAHGTHDINPVKGRS